MLIGPKPQGQQVARSGGVEVVSLSGSVHKKF